MPANHNDLEKRLWSAADELRANSKLKSSEYSIPVLGLIFLRYADHRFTQAKVKLTSQGSGRRKIGKADYQARGVLYLPEAARFSTLLNLPEGADIAKAITEAMKAIEADNDDLKDVLPRTYNRLDKELLVSLLKNFAAIPMDIEGDAFGKIYEYFLGKFAMSEGQKGGEFFTPTSGERRSSIRTVEAGARSSSFKATLSPDLEGLVDLRDGLKFKTQRVYTGRSAFLD